MKHGTRSAYAHQGCRCAPCTEAARVYESGRRVTWAEGARSVIPLKQLRRDVQEEDEVDDGLEADVDAERPKTRAECPESRPCPWLACRYHLGLEVTPRGSLRPPLPGWEERETCALDVAARPVEPTLEEVGGLLGITKERVRQIEMQALLKLHQEDCE